MLRSPSGVNSLKAQLRKPRIDRRRAVPWKQLLRRDGGAKMVRLQQATARRAGMGGYTKFTISVPREAVSSLGWTKGQRLAVYVEKKRLIFAPPQTVKRKRPEREHTRQARDAAIEVPFPELD